MIFFDEVSIHPGTDVVDAHVLAIDEDDARPESLMVNAGIVLWQILAESITHQGAGPVRPTGAQHEAVKLSAVTVVKEGILQLAIAVGVAEVDAEHFLGQDPAVLSVDPHSGAFIEDRFVVAVILEKFDVDWPLPLRLEVLDVDSCVRIPKVVRIRHE